MGNRFLVLAYVRPTDDGDIHDWWASTGAGALAALPGAGVARLARVVEGNPSHVVLSDWDDVSGLTMASLYGAFADAPAAAAPWSGIGPVGAAILGAQMFPAASDSAPVAAAFETGSHGYVALTNVDADVEDGFNEWYNHRHLPAVAGAGLTEGTRFETLGSGHKYLATYHIDGPESMHSEELGKVRGFDEFTGKAYDLTRLVFQVMD